MIQALPGFRDFYPADCAARRYVFEKWRETARRYGFVEMDGPVLESVELYRKKSGGELVGQLFNFVDKGEREVTLRPEMTPTLARMVAARDREFKKPLKWFSVASFFRYEKQQKGRLREFTQLNCDLVGESSLAADAEMIALAIDLFRTFGLTEKDFYVRISDRRVWEDFAAEREISSERFPELLQLIDRLEKNFEFVSEELWKKFGIDLSEVMALLEKPTESIPIFGELQQNLAARGLQSYVVFDPSIVRGLAYYTGVVFEVSDRARASRALAGGGRYDELVGTISDGAVKHPALGFAVGDVTLLDLLRQLPHTAALLDAATRAAAAAEVYVVIADEAFRPQALGLIGELRAAGRRVDFPLTTQKVGKQLQAAETLGAARAVIVGAEWPQVKIKTLATREEQTVKSADIATVLASANLSTG